MPTIPEGIIKRIHVNQHVIRRNEAEGESKPVVSTKTSSGNEYGHEVEIIGPGGDTIAKVVSVYGGARPLSCGARVWVETRCEVNVISHKPPST